MRLPTASRTFTVVPLVAAAGMHAAWGLGASFPFDSTDELSDQVVGSARAPSPASCYAVAGVLGVAALLVAVPRPGPVRRTVVRVGAAALAVRAAFGFAGRTDLLVPGSSSPAFRRNDRRLFSPICAVLAGGLAASMRR